jgi:hypothetical protein
LAWHDDLTGGVVDIFEFHGLLGILIVIGLATGTLTGLTGASGMSILISSLLLAGIEIRQVIGLTFVITFFNAAIALSAYWKHGHVDMRSGLLMATPATAAVLVGHGFSRSIDASWLTVAMTVCLFLIGLKFLASPEDKKETSVHKSASRGNVILLVVMGGLAGLVMGVMGGGGAVFIAAALMILLKMETKTAIGTSILIMGLAAIPGVVSHWQSQTINFSYAVAILASSIPAALLASSFANRVPTALVKRILGIYLVIISTLMCVRLFN